MESMGGKPGLSANPFREKAPLGAFPSEAALTDWVTDWVTARERVERRRAGT